MRHVALVATTLALGLPAVGCGDDTTTSTLGATKPVSVTAYDTPILEQVQGDIESELRRRVTGKVQGADISKVRARCVADNARTFTCYTRVNLSVDGQCAEISAEERGSVTAAGATRWVATKTDDPEITACP